MEQKITNFKEIKKGSLIKLNHPSAKMAMVLNILETKNNYAIEFSYLKDFSAIWDMIVLKSSFHKTWRVF